MQESRWPVIIFSRILAFGRSFDVFSLSRFPAVPSRYLDTRDSTVDSVIITPSHGADVSARLVSGNGRDVTCGELPAFCAGVFLYAVRGLPSSEIEVEASDKIYRITKTLKNRKTSIILPKCKLLYANKRENVDEMETFVSSFSYKNRIFKLVECKYASHFSDANLRTLLRSSIEDSIDGVAAYSLQGSEATVKYILTDPSDASSLLNILLAVATAALSKGVFSPDLTVKYDGGKIRVTLWGDELAVSDEKMEIFTLTAPNIE